MARVKSETDDSPRAGDGAASDPMEQVRELLFGETQRANSEHMRAIDEKIDALRADFAERLASLESRLVDLARETERSQAASVNAIGGAIAQLGATIQNMSARGKGG